MFGQVNLCNKTSPLNAEWSRVELSPEPDPDPDPDPDLSSDPSELTLKQLISFTLPVAVGLLANEKPAHALPRLATPARQLAGNYLSSERLGIPHLFPFDVAATVCDSEDCSSQRCQRREEANIIKPSVRAECGESSGAFNKLWLGSGCGCKLAPGPAFG